MSSLIHSKEILIKRVRRFFEEAPSERRPVVSFVRSLGHVADVCIFGGVVRDIWLHGVSSFRSDVDLVVRVHNPTGFQSLISQFNHTKNKFGGYRIQESRWMIDLWEFENTWAFSKGHISPIGIGSLLKTTFFDWDSIAYDYSKDKIYCHNDYFSRVHNRVLDINLRENPNEEGALVRSLRFIAKERVKTGPFLSHFIIKELGTKTDHDILRYELGNFNNPYLSESILALIRKRSNSWNDRLETFSWLDQIQPSLFDMNERP